MEYSITDFIVFGEDTIKRNLANAEKIREWAVRAGVTSMRYPVDAGDEYTVGGVSDAWCNQWLFSPPLKPRF